jgi:hypothetical protein
MKKFVVKKGNFSLKLATLVILFSVLPTFTNCQITTTKVVSSYDNLQASSYDSTKNFLLKDVAQYIGQKFYLPGKTETLREFGYENFLIDYKKEMLGNPKNIYKCCDNYNSKYEDLAGKYFKVLDVIKHPKSIQNDYLYGNKYFLKLQEVESKDIVYFEYDNRFENSFPFIVVGFYEKTKSKLIGSEFVFSDVVLKSSKDIRTGNPISIITGQIWKCIDLTVDEKWFNLSLIIENKLNQRTFISYESVFGLGAINRLTFTPDEVELYKIKFGVENFTSVLEDRLRVGMSKELCNLVYGEPTEINDAQNEYGKVEQWIYSGKYIKTKSLFFKDDILISFSISE